ncbi:hypothetical protein M0805_000764 [Coniferiporia weirii]|nr:hypothetical protein M0805_000764 [Coniferiporia weirii]
MAVATSEPPHAHLHQHQSPHQHSLSPHQHHQHQHSPLPHQQHPHALHAQPHPLHAHAHAHLPHSPGKDHEHDVHGLRLALGSILSPKRYASPSSHASSGSASPCPAHFGPGLVHPYHPPPSHGHSHLHTPSDGESEPDTATAAVVVVRDTADDAGARDRGRSEKRDGRKSALHSRVHSVSAPESPAAAGVAAPPILTTSNYTAPRPAAGGAMQRKHSGSDVGASAHDSGTGSPGGYIATLQSKRAWDALVHGNMS